MDCTHRNAVVHGEDKPTFPDADFDTFGSLLVTLAEERILTKRT
jgi:hypothetical protein